MGAKKNENRESMNAKRVKNRTYDLEYDIIKRAESDVLIEIGFIASRFFPL
jgi:hypothetical protein